MKAPIQPASSHHLGSYSPHLGLCFVPTWKDPSYPPPTQHFSFFKAQFNLACPTTSHQAQGSSFQGILWHLRPYGSGGRAVKSPGLSCFLPLQGGRTQAPVSKDFDSSLHPRGPAVQAPHNVRSVEYMYTQGTWTPPRHIYNFPLFRDSRALKPAL